jgi:hypothetical protein
MSLFVVNPNHSNRSALQALDQSALRARLNELYGASAWVMLALEKQVGLVIEIPYHDEASLDRRHIRGVRKESD